MKIKLPHDLSQSPPDSHPLTPAAEPVNVSEAAEPSQTPTDLEFFIRRTFEKDEALGCELLFRHYYQPLCNHAVKLLYSKAMAEDLVSDLFYQFYLKGTFRTITTSYRAYLYKAVRHRAYNCLRWEVQRSLPLDSAAVFSDDTHLQPDSITQYEDLYHDLEDAIDTLPPQRRKIYVMHRFESKKYAEIAQELQLAIKTVEGQIRTASHHIRDLLRKKWLMLAAGWLAEWLC